MFHQAQRLTRVVKRQCKVPGSQGANQIHGKDIAGALVQNAHENDGPRADIERKNRTEFTRTNFRCWRRRTSLGFPLPVRVIHIANPKPDPRYAVIPATSGLENAELFITDSHRLRHAEPNFSEQASFSLHLPEPQQQAASACSLASSFYQSDADGERTDANHDVVVGDVDTCACALEPNANLRLRITKSDNALLRYVRRTKNQLPERLPRMGKSFGENGRTRRTHAGVLK